MKRLSLLLVAILAAVMLGGCEDGPKILIDYFECDTCKEDDFQAGEICADSNVDGCPFTVVDRLQTMTLEDKTFECRLLEADGYIVTFEEVEGYESPGAMDIELDAGQRIIVTGLYEPE